MLIDCDGCRMEGTEACEDCLVTFLLDPSTERAADRPVGPSPLPPSPVPPSPFPPSPVARVGGVGEGRDGRSPRPARAGLRAVPAAPIEIDEDERRALEALAEFGLIPPLRRTSGPDGPDQGTSAAIPAPRSRAERAAG